MNNISLSTSEKHELKYWKYTKTDVKTKFICHLNLIIIYNAHKQIVTDVIACLVWRWTDDKSTGRRMCGCQV